MKNLAENQNRKNKVFTLVDKAPFAGKFAVREAYVGFDAASDKRKTPAAIGSAAFLALMVAGHAYQAKLGIDSLSIHAPAATEGNAKDVIYSGIDGTYALAMSAVAARQAQLFGKVGQKYYRWRKVRKSVPENERRIHKRPMAVKPGAVALAIGVTLGGQVAELVSTVDAVQEKVKQTDASYSEQSSDQMKRIEDMYNSNVVYIDSVKSKNHK